MRSLISLASLALFAISFAAAPAMAGEQCCTQKPAKADKQVCKCEDPAKCPHAKQCDGCQCPAGEKGEKKAERK